MMVKTPNQNLRDALKRGEEPTVPPTAGNGYVGEENSASGAGTTPPESEYQLWGSRRLEDFSESADGQLVWFGGEVEEGERQGRLLFHMVSEEEESVGNREVDS